MECIFTLLLCQATRPNRCFCVLQTTTATPSLFHPCARWLLRSAQLGSHKPKTTEPRCRYTTTHCLQRGKFSQASKMFKLGFQSYYCMPLMQPPDLNSSKLPPCCESHQMICLFRLPISPRINQKIYLSCLCLKILLLTNITSSLSFYPYQKDERAKPGNLLTRWCFFAPVLLLSSLTHSLFLRL
jgi:hypothetical protein